MFKWSKRRPSEEPSTPKLSSISLPEETPVKAVAASQWMSAIVPKSKSAFSDKVSDHRSKSHPVATDVFVTSKPAMKGSRVKSSQPVESDEILKPPKPAKPADLDEDNESGYLSSRETKQRPEKRLSKDGAPLKGILKPSKPFKEQESSKPVIPVSSYPEKGGPHKLNEGAGYHASAMDGGGKLHRTPSERHAENTSQDAVRPKYRQLPPAFAQGTFHGGIPPAHPGYPSHTALMATKSPYYPESKPPAFALAEKPFIPPQNPSRASSHRRHSSRSREWGGGFSDTEGPPRVSHSSRRAGGMLSDTEDMPRSHSSRYGGGIMQHDSQRGMYQAAQQPGYGYDHTARHRAATYPVYPEPNNVSPTQYFQGADYYPRTRNHSFSGQPIPGPSRPAGMSRYVKPHYNSVPQKEEAVSLSWPLLEYSKRHRQRQPVLYFDIAFDPSEPGYQYIRAYHPGESVTRCISQEELDTPASSHCVLTEMTIVCEERELGRWSLIARRAEGLRCIDIFKAIYDGYHVPLTSKEKRELGDCVQMCEPTFHQRCKDSPGLDLKNRERGVCRVDLLRSKRLFKGLTRRSGHWVLEVDRIHN